LVRSLLRKYHQEPEKTIPFPVQAQIYEHLMKVQAGETYLYTHISFDRCKALVSDCWVNSKRQHSRKRVNDTGLRQPVGRPRNDKAVQQEIVNAQEQKTPAVSPYNPFV